MLNVARAFVLLGLVAAVTACVGPFAIGPFAPKPPTPAPPPLTPAKPAGMCPEGWEVGSTQCYKIFTDRKPWQEAGEACQLADNQSRLVTIANMDDHRMMDKTLQGLETCKELRRRSIQPPLAWTSMHASGKEWVWEDGGIVRQPNWTVDGRQVDKLRKIGDCVVLGRIGHMLVDCNLELKCYVCTAQLINGSCKTNEDLQSRQRRQISYFKGNGTCYSVVKEQSAGRNWDNATSFCSQFAPMTAMTPLGDSNPDISRIKQIVKAGGCHSPELREKVAWLGLSVQRNAEDEKTGWKWDGSSVQDGPGPVHWDTTRGDQLGECGALKAARTNSSYRPNWSSGFPPYDCPLHLCYICGRPKLPQRY